MIRLAVIALVALGAHVAHSLAQDENPQIVIPKRSGAGGYSLDMHPVETSLWEYSDKRRHITTGKHITFSLPRAYYTDTANGVGGPQSSIDLAFDLTNERPWLVGGAGQTTPRGRAGNSERLRREISITLRSYGNAFGSVPAKLVLLGNGLPVALGSHIVTSREGSYCGFEVFDTDEPWRIVNLRGGDKLDPKVSQVPPFNRGKRFGRPEAGGTYSQVVGCNQLATPGYPWCAINSHFQGWPMTVRFSGEHLCELDGILKSATKFLRRYMVEDTDRRPGELENRDTSANRSVGDQ